LGIVHTKEAFLAIISPEMAQRNLEKQAEKLGANAIVGLKIEAKQRRSHAQKYSAYGTAVIAEWLQSRLSFNWLRWQHPETYLLAFWGR
jgi:hypothetical protein